MPLDRTVEAILGYHAYWSMSKTELYRILRTSIEYPRQGGTSMTNIRLLGFTDLQRINAFVELGMAAVFLLKP